MRDRTICRQDAGSTLGVTFKPPLKRYLEFMRMNWLHFLSRRVGRWTNLSEQARVNSGERHRLFRPPNENPPVPCALGCKYAAFGLKCPMLTLEQVENQVKLWTKAEQEALLDWLANMLEDQLEFTEEFKAKIQRGEQDIREGRVRVRKP